MMAHLSISEQLYKMASSKDGVTEQLYKMASTKNGAPEQMYKMAATRVLASRRALPTMLKASATNINNRLDTITGDDLRIAPAYNVIHV